MTELELLHKLVMQLINKELPKRLISFLEVDQAAISNILLSHDGKICFLCRNSSGSFDPIYMLVPNVLLFIN